MPDNIIDRAFAPDLSLRKRIHDAISTSPQYGSLFHDIAQYHLSSQTANGTVADADDQPASKKRRLNGVPSITNGTGAPQQTQPREVVLEARDISFSLPQRKKYHFGVAQYGKDISAASTTFSIFIRNPVSNEIELEIPVSQFACALRLPVPEKAAKLYNFCLLPKTDSQQAPEPWIWTVPHGPVKTLDIPSAKLSKIATADSSDDAIFETALSFVFSWHGLELTQPKADEFASATPESHRKNEKAYHVRAFRGSKDGFLFFLQNGIFFGFKKPLTFFAFEHIESVSYTSVLQRTFNLSIAYRSPQVGETNGELGEIQEIEFGMIDQADFPGIDAYIKKHGLQDASLAESRRATKAKAAANGRAASRGQGDGEGAEGDETDERTELEKAQQQLEDEEDEEEEDYDPSSEDDSDGSDDSSDDDDDQQDRKERKRATKGKDLVAEELGSEAEDVSITEDEDDGQEGEGGEEAEEEEYDDADELQQDIKPAIAPSGFAAVAMTSKRKPGRWGGQMLGRWVSQKLPSPNPDDDDQL